MLCLLVAAALAQPWQPTPDLQTPAIPREFRAAWVATVANIDWPTKRDAPVSEQRAEMIATITSLKDAGFNAIIFQVRPACDALYPSTLEPWSEFLTGQSGKAPQPAWDPLAEWIAQCHARGMELHAWINPYRARHFESKKPDADTHVTKAHPDWVRSYDRFLWLDPGEPAAAEHSLAVVKDIVTRYDLDGLHIDDYFYPYPKGSDPFPDETTFARYKASGGTLARDDWRRDNINRFVQSLYTTAHAARPAIKVGISPFGIWKPDQPAGVKGLDAHARLYADAKLWLNQGWLDYCSPQLYWKRDAKEQPFATLLAWWRGENTKHRALWPGLYTSKLLPAEKSQWTKEEILGQIELLHTPTPTSPTTPPGTQSIGEVHFSSRAITTNAGGIRDALKAGPYAIEALPPAMTWLDSTPPATPTLSANTTPAGIECHWSAAPAKDGTTPEPVARWVIAAKLPTGWVIRVVGPNESNATLDRTTYAVALWAADHANNLSTPAVMIPQ